MNNYNKISTTLKRNAVFCLTNDDKSPYLSKVNDKSSFYSFDEALQLIEKNGNKHGLGVGIFDDICGIDIDHCFDDDNKLNKTSVDIINFAKSYTEKSPSGKGIRIFFTCKPNNQFDYKNNNYGVKNTDTKVEIYQGNKDNRYLSVTGDLFGSKDVREFTKEEIEEFFHRFMKQKENACIESDVTSRTYSVDKSNNYFEIGLSKDAEFIELWNKKASDCDQSSIDLALLSKLAFWCNQDAEDMIARFEASPYFKSKDSLHIKKWARNDYRNMTIAKAIENTPIDAARKNLDFLNKSNDKKLAEAKASEIIKKDEVLSEYEQTSAGVKGLESFLKELKEFDPTKMVKTKFDKLNETLGGGLDPRRLYVVGAAPSVGKTTFLLQIADQIAISGKDVLFVSFETSDVDLIAKSISRITYEKGKPLSSQEVLKSNLFVTSDEQKEVLRDSFDVFGTYAKRIYIYDFSAEPYKDIDKIIENHFKQTGNKPVVIVDYLQLMAKRMDNKNNINDKDKVDLASNKLKSCAAKHNIPIICISSLNRVSYKAGNYNADSRGPDLTSFKESGQIEYDADVIITMSVSKTNESNLFGTSSKEIKLSILKSKYGPSGVDIEYIYNPKFNYFKEK